MKIKRIVSIFVYVLVISAVICFAADNKVDLKLRLAAGESHEMKMTQIQNITQTMMGQEQEVNQVQEMIMGWKTLSVDANGNMDIEITYKSMKTTMDGPMGRMEFDSANPKPVDPNRPDQQMMTNMISAIAGSKFQMKMTPTAKTLEIHGLKEMLARMKEKMGSTAMPGMDKLFDKMFDEKQLKEMTGSMMGSFPAEPVAVGDAWYDTMSMNFIMPIDMDMTYMLKQRKDGIAYIDMTAKLDMGDNSKPIDIDPNNKVSMQMSGTINATSQVDEKTGLTKKSDMTMNLSGVTKMGANPQMPDGMTMPMTIQGNAVVELIK
ncbi:MAG: DUF6263 family protein [Sedimentisphaerales bacterium]